MYMYFALSDVNFRRIKTFFRLKAALDETSIGSEKVQEISEKKDAQIREKEELVAVLQNDIHEKEKLLVEKDTIIKERGSLLSEKDAAIKNKDSKINESEASFRELEKRIVEKDRTVEVAQKDLEIAQVAVAEGQVKLKSKEEDADNLREQVARVSL